MNKAVANDTVLLSPNYNNFRCKYNAVTNKFWFGNLQDTFDLNFDTQLTYEKSCRQVDVWNHYTRWGLPAYLGYKKQVYMVQNLHHPIHGSVQEFPVTHLVLIMKWKMVVEMNG